MTTATIESGIKSWSRDGGLYQGPIRLGRRTIRACIAWQPACTQGVPAVEDKGYWIGTLTTDHTASRSGGRGMVALRSYRGLDRGYPALASPVHPEAVRLREELELEILETAKAYLSGRSGTWYAD